MVRIACMILHKLSYIPLFSEMHLKKFHNCLKHIKLLWHWWWIIIRQQDTRSSPPETFLGKGVPKICSKFTGENPCRSEISIKLESNFIEIKLRYECSPVNLLRIFRAPFPKNTVGGLLLKICRNWKIESCNINIGK